MRANFISNFLLTASSFIFPLITLPYVTRTLTAAGIGKVSLAVSVENMFAMVAMLGIPTYGIRECARIRDNKELLSRTVRELLIIQFAMTFISLAAFAVTVMVTPKLRGEPVLYLIEGGCLLLGACNTDWLFAGLEQYVYISKRSLTVRFCCLILTFLLVRNTGDYPAYALIMVLFNVSAYLINVFLLKRYIAPKPKEKYNIKRHFGHILVFFAQTVAITVYTNLDTVMLGFMRTDSDVGLYNAAVKVKVILVALITSLGTVLLPRLSYYVHNGNRLEFRKQTEKALNFLLVAALPLSVFFLFYAGDCVLLLFGESFSGAAPAMRVIMPTVLLIGLSNFTGMQILTPTGRENKVLISVAAGAIVDIILNALLIPSLGAEGAAIGTLAAEAVVLLIQLYYVAREATDRPRCYSLIRVSCAVAISAVAAGLPVLLKLKSVYLRFPLCAVIFFAAYAALLLIFREPIACQSIHLLHLRKHH